MSYMFSNCTSLDNLYLDSFDTGNVTNMEDTFYYCNNLQTIVVSSNWTTENVSSSVRMFNGCTNISGEKGTTYNDSHTNATYARIDGGPDSDTPGYFTANSVLKGDIDQDEFLTIEDAKLAKRIAMKDPTVDYTKINADAGDLDKNGKITINEARKIKRAALGEITLD